MLKYNRHLFKLMQGLFYPAVLGTFIVFFISDISAIFKSPEILIQLNFLYTLVLITYFCISFLTNENLSGDECYSAATFIFDCVEIVLMYFCFHYLKIEESFINEYSLRNFYFAACGIPFIQFFWNISLGETRWVYLFLDVLGTVTFLVGGLWIYKFPIGTYTLFTIQSMILFFYLYYRINVDRDLSA